MKTESLRNEAALNCVSLRSQLEHEVMWGLSRIQMNVPYGTPLVPTSPPEEGYADGKQLTKVGRHVGLDFYDLLIEGDNAQTPMWRHFERYGNLSTRTTFPT
jgi:hypothetical protein